MHKKVTKSYGGLWKKYGQEASLLACCSVSIIKDTERVAEECRSSEFSSSEIQTSWMNGPYRTMQYSENLVAELEARVNAEAQIPDKCKREFIQDWLEPAKCHNREAREIDDCLMRGMIPPGMQ